MPDLLFVNLDPDTYGVTANEAEDPLLNLLSARRGKLVVEIIENSDVSDAYLSQQLAAAFSRHGIRLALDDIGAPNSMISIDVMMEVDWFKFDRSWLARARDSKGRAVLNHLIAFAHECNCKVILEGIEPPKTSHWPMRWAWIACRLCVPQPVQHDLHGHPQHALHGMNTVAALLAQARQLGLASVDARLLLSHVSGLNHAQQAGRRKSNWMTPTPRNTASCWHAARPASRLPT